MSEFRAVKRGDIPPAKTGPTMKPRARLARTGFLYLSVKSIEALGNRNCRVMVEFDEESLMLKMTVMDKPPKGFSEEDLFPVTIKVGKRNTKPTGQIYMKSLLRYIGHPANGKPQEFPVTAVDPVNRSISLVVPACEDSSN